MQTLRGWHLFCRVSVVCLGVVGVLLSTSVQAQPYVYFTTNHSDTDPGDIYEMAVLDTATNMVVATIPVATWPNVPTGIAVHPAGTFVYLVSSIGNIVTVVDTATNMVVTTVPVGRTPQGIAVHPTGAFVYVTNQADSSMSVLATATNTVIATVPAVPVRALHPPGPYIAVHPAGSFIYIQTGSTVTVLSTATNYPVVASVPLGGPAGIAVHPGGALVYVANAQGFNVVNVLTTEPHMDTGVSVSVGDTPQGVAMHPAGTFLYVANFGSNTMSVVDTATNTALTPVVVGDTPEQVVVHPAGTFVYVTTVTGITVVDTTTNMVITTVPVAFPNALGIASGGVSPPDGCNDFTPWTRRHIDRTNPQAEGWTANKGTGGGVIAKGMNDNGLRAWYVDDNSVALGSLYTYEQIPEECEITLGKTIGWTLRTRVRVVDINQAPNFSVFASYQDGTHEWPMIFGADDLGNPIVKLPTGTGPTPEPGHAIVGANAYHLYELVFKPNTQTADLFVDGLLVQSDYEGRAEGQTPLVYWGGGQSETTGQGNYNLVEFFVGPGEQHSVGGSATGVTVRNVLCRNVSTGLEVVIPDVLTSWDCEDAGLVVNPGDRVNMIIRSIVD